MRPLYIMLVGLPGSGKSYIERQLRIKAWYIAPGGLAFACGVGTDGYIETCAERDGKTYTEVFNKYIDAATKEMAAARKSALKAAWNIIHDQTNLTIKSRAAKLADIPRDYIKIAVFCHVDEATRQIRIAIRPGKTIPPHVDENMRENLQIPTVDEGFDFVLYSEEIINFVLRYYGGKAE